MATSVERYDRDWFPPAVARFVEAVEAGGPGWQTRINDRLRKVAGLR
jgi:hypothetical protein